jgi:hypothetical protein
MYHLAKNNLVILGLAAAMTGLAFVFRGSGTVLGLGGNIALAAFFFMKGFSSLQSRGSDILLSCLVLLCLVLSRAIGGQTAPWILEGTALILTGIFIFTGLTFKAMALEQKRKREIARRRNPKN